MQPNLPRPVLAKAYASPGSGEFAWRRADVPEAVRALTASDYAILGGEVWLVSDPRANWTGLIPCRDSRPDGVWSWDTKPRQAGETWEVFRDRTARETIESVEAMRVEDESDPSVVPYLWFNISFIAAHEA
jgi:hypothetical protein